MSTPLSRPQDKKVIAGVCAGLAERFGMSPFVVRLLFLLSCLLPGPQFLLYLGLWVMMPERPHRERVAAATTRPPRTGGPPVSW